LNAPSMTSFAKPWNQAAAALLLNGRFAPMVKCRAE